MSTSAPAREIRALYDQETIRVYQAYSDLIADSALRHQTFVAPPFKLERMTWIKPSFLWMMYRAGWGYKDEGQKRILAIDITHEGFTWALAHSCPSHPEEGMSDEIWRQLMTERPVRVQWDPERDLFLRPQTHRSIQIGLSQQAVILYASEWIKRITDVTPLAHDIHALVDAGKLEAAHRQLPWERPYIVESDAS